MVSTHKTTHLTQAAKDLRTLIFAEGSGFVCGCAGASGVELEGLGLGFQVFGRPLMAMRFGRATLVDDSLGCSIYKGDAC